MCSECAPSFADHIPGVGNMVQAPAGEYPELPEPAMPASAGVCCGNLTAGAQYMGQTEMLCCGEPDEAYPGHYSTDQMRAYADATHAMRSNTCVHRIADARNSAVESGYVCIDCGAIFAAADHGAMRAGEQEPVADSFREWFTKNYPTDTIILDPEWHARSIYRMAMAHARLTSPVATQGEQDTIKARRYDYLRDGVIVDGEINEDLYVHVDHQSYPNRWALTGPELDEAIDAALSATTQVATTKDDE